MHLVSAKIKNFRVIEDIYVDFNSRVNVIVGPNAAGKTTVLEAIRLLKAMLAPRLQNEAVHVLQSLGAASPHMPNRIRQGAIARDPERDVVIGCRFALSERELNDIGSSIDAIARSVVQSQVGQNFSAPDALLAFMSSDQGKMMFNTAKQVALQTLATVQSTRQCYLELNLSPSSGLGSPSDPMEREFVAFLERNLPPYKTAFTYFPADRALPAGEQPVQLGGPDTAQQMESYNAQPQIKFNRLKNTIFGASIMGEDSSKSLIKQFEGIFQGILKGRQLVGFGVNEIGLLSVQIKDTESGRVFDLDSMSSGEKGLILTFLLMSRSIQTDGIVLLDEPELHLNPAVCKDFLPYLIEHYVRPQNIQILVCSHSPEILAGAFDSDDCALYHLISPMTLSKVRPQDEVTLDNALKRLGATESENLLYRGIIFVEGPDDVALLEAGFASLLRRYKLKFSAGRREIEKAIRSLQLAENTGDLREPTYFIFDRDDEPTDLTSSVSARVLQWDRRCLENYLIDLDAISNLLMDEEITREPFSNPGDVSRILRELAFQQLDEAAIRAVYARQTFVGLGLRRDDLNNRPIEEMAGVLQERLNSAKAELAAIDTTAWRDDFIQNVQRERRQLEAVWETKWISDCDGKRLLDDLSKRTKLRLSLKRFKVRLMREIALNRSETWSAVDGHLRLLLSDLPS